MTEEEWYTKERIWWNEYSEPMLEQWSLSPMANKLVRSNVNKDLIHFLFNRNGRFLDVGCGAGWLAVNMAKMGMDVVGIDISSEQIKQAKSRAEADCVDQRVSFIEKNIVDWEIPVSLMESFDSISYNAFLHHLPDRDIGILLMKLKSLLKTGGRLYLYEPCYQENVRTRSPVLIKLADKIIQKSLVVFLIIVPRLLELQREKFRDLDAKGYTGCSPCERPLSIEFLASGLEGGFCYTVKGHHLYSLQLAMKAVEMKSWYRTFLVLLTPLFRACEILVFKSRRWWAVSHSRRFSMVGIRATKIDD